MVTVRQWGRPADFQQILKEISTYCNVNAEDPGVSRHVEFWRKCDFEQFPREEVKLTEHLLILLSPDGVFYLRRWPGEIDKLDHYQTLSDLFFHGPVKFVEKMHVRGSLKAKVLPYVTGFEVADGYPIFDYTLIPQKRWEYNVDELRNTGNSVEVSGTGVGFYGWSGWDSGGGREYTFEQYFTRKDLQDKCPHEFRSLLDKLLSGAIAKGWN